MTSPRVLITGGAGFIGSNIAAELAPTLEVAVCDWLGEADTGKWRNLVKHPIADFVAPEALKDWLAGRGRDVETIIHMGAISSTSEPDADKIVATNFGLSRDLFDWCGREGRRFIWASSAATYGDGSGGFDDDPSLAALTALRPLNAYGWSKALFDAYAVRQASRGATPIQWVGLKFFNVYGPNEAHKGAMRSVVHQLWPKIKAGEAARLFRSYRANCADGGQMRDFIYVNDAAAVIAWLCRNPGVNGIFNLGSGTARSFADLALAVFAAAKLPPRIDYVPMPAGLAERYQYFTQARMDRLRAAGYDATFATLEAGVADYVMRYLATDDPYR